MFGRGSSEFASVALVISAHEAEPIKKQFEG
jgi:hypothetical protein